MRQRYRGPATFVSTRRRESCSCHEINGCGLPAKQSRRAGPNMPPRPESGRLPACSRDQAWPLHRDRGMRQLRQTVPIDPPRLRTRSRRSARQMAPPTAAAMRGPRACRATTWVCRCFVQLLLPQREQPSPTTTKRRRSPPMSFRAPHTSALVGAVLPWTCPEGYNACARS